MKVQVTAEDIACGIAHTPKHCPLARALRRVPGVAWAAVQREVAVVYLDDGPPRTLPLPSHARDFVSAFDGGRKVEPAAFELDTGEGGAAV